MSPHDVSPAAMHEHPYASFIQKIEKPVRYLGGEHGAAHKPWDGVRARVVLAFPDLYDIGMSHLGFKILYGILNKHPATLAERAYAPWTDMEAELRARGLPLVTLESGRSLAEFDVVGFSLQFELTYSNVLLMLDLGGIPLRSSDRTDAHPLVIAGGPTATHPEPLAPFIDAFVIGDGEEVAVELPLAWAALRDANMPREQRLREIAKIPGVYVPSLYTTRRCDKSGLDVVDAPRVPEASPRIVRAFIDDIDRFPFPSDGPVAATETVFDRISVEIARGCTEGCRFCQAGMIYRPVRERSPESIVKTITEAVRAGGYDEASLTSLSTADYSCIAPLVRKVMAELRDEKVSLSVSSLRAYGLTEDLLDEIQQVRATGLTFAPEAGTQRMRDVVNKNVTEEQLMETAHRVFSRGWSKMKLYFMIGLPTETDEDVIGIVETGRKARDIGRSLQKGKPPTVTVSVSTHVPKPHTPFQWCALDTLAEIRRKQGILRERARSARVDLRMHESRGSTLEGVFARGDRRLADVLEHAYRHGARFDSWEERLNWSAWSDAFAASAIDPDAYLGTIPVDARLPWDHIDVGLEDGFLVREYRRALANRLSPPCGKAVGMFVHHTNAADAAADARKLVCYDCGVACDLTSMRDDRLVKLRVLGAESPRVREERPEITTPEQRRPRASFAQGESRRVRLAFERIGRSAFQSHLDLLRIVPRVFRRAGVPLRYSQGFHPKPEMVFGPALALGIATLDEFVEVKIHGDVAMDALPGLLQPGAPEGLRFVRAAALTDADEPLNRVIDATEYVAAIAWSALRDIGLHDLAAVRAHVTARRAAGPLHTLRRREGLSRKIDVESKLISLEVGEGAATLADAWLIGDLLPVRFISRASPDGTCKPSEVIAALFDDALAVRFVRSRQGTLTNDTAIISPLDLVGLREHRPKTAAVAQAPADVSVAAL